MANAWLAGYLFYCVLCYSNLLMHSYTVKDCSWRVTRRAWPERGEPEVAELEVQCRYNFVHQYIIIVCCACIIDLSYSTWSGGGGGVLANGVVARKPLPSDTLQKVRANFIVAALSRKPS